MLSDTACSEDYDHDPFYQQITTEEICQINEELDEQEKEELMQQELKKQQRQKLGLQNAVKFEFSLFDGSLIRFMEDDKTKKNLRKFKTEIEEKVQNISMKGYQDFFNYGLNTTTWRLFVNKQILMRYERLFIEKQINERKQKEHEFNRQIQQVEQEINNVTQQIERIKNPSSQPSTESSQAIAQQQSKNKKQYQGQQMPPPPLQKNQFALPFNSQNESGHKYQQ